MLFFEFLSEIANFLLFFDFLPSETLADVVKCDIPLLLSKDAMKKAAMQIDFKADVVKIFGKPSKLFFTSTGHYCIPIVEQLNHLKPKVQEHLSLFVNFDKTKTEEKLKLAKKLHLQFSHPTYPKLKLLLNDAGIVDPEMLEALKSIANTCDTCLKYRKAPPQPIVGLSMAHNDDVISIPDHTINEEIGCIIIVHVNVLIFFMFYKIYCNVFYLFRSDIFFVLKNCTHRPVAP